MENNNGNWSWLLLKFIHFPFFNFLLRLFGASTGKVSDEDTRYRNKLSITRVFCSVGHSSQIINFLFYFSYPNAYNTKYLINQSLYLWHDALYFFACIKYADSITLTITRTDMIHAFFYLIKFIAVCYAWIDRNMLHITIIQKLLIMIVIIVKIIDLMLHICPREHLILFHLFYRNIKTLNHTIVHYIIK